MPKIVTDTGTEYINQVLQELCALMKVEKVNSTPYHHETVLWRGPAEHSTSTYDHIFQITGLIGTYGSNLLCIVIIQRLPRLLSL